MKELIVTTSVEPRLKVLLSSRSSSSDLLEANQMGFITQVKAEDRGGVINHTCG
jgi:hypothetical protein